MNKLLSGSIILLALAVIFNSLSISKIKDTQLRLGAPSQNLLNVATSTITTLFANGIASTTIQPASTTLAGTLSVLKTLTLFGGFNASSTATSTMANGIQLYGGCFRDIGGSCIVGGLSAAITSLNSLTGATQTFSSNDLLTITSAGTNHHVNASTSPYFGGITATGTIAFTNLSSGLVANNSGTLYGSIATSSASCSGSVSCSSFTVVGSVSPTITSSASLFAWTPETEGNATSTKLLLKNGFISSASSTISNNLSVSTLSSGLIASGNGLLYGGIATGTISSSGGITTTASRSVLGGSLAISCDVASGSQAGCLSSTDWTTFNNKAGFAYLFPSNATTSSLTIGGILSTASSTFSSNLDLSGGTVKQTLSSSFSYATSTTFTGTTTRQLGTANVAETWNYAICYTTVGTLNISFSDGTNLMNMISASATPARFALTTNNSFTKDEKRQVAIGTPASSPLEVSCTIEKIVN